MQGLTEFLPVSSSGHIVLANELLSNEVPDLLTFTVAVHCATVLSTVVVFYKDIWLIIKGLFAFQWNEETQFAARILLSMLPLLPVYLLFKDDIKQVFDGNVLLVGGMLIVTGGLLLISHFTSKQHRSVNFPKAFIIGIAQAVAVLPGISRSGSTIATGLILGVDKDKIARFSFLMVIPPILGATLLDVKDLVENPSAYTIDPVMLLIGFFSAFITGLVACKMMIAIVRKGKLQYFAYYCFLVGAVAMGTALFT